jgi:hypothetical protein
MYVISKPLEAINEADIENLRTNKVAEQKLIDYKMTLPGISDGDLSTGQKFDNLPPDSNIEALEVGH